MQVIIKPQEDGSYTVDGLEVRQDTNGNWVGNENMTPNQVACFQRHLIAVKEHQVSGEASYKTT